MDIVPAIDIIDGKCVRLTEGDFGRKTDYGMDPLDVAKAFEDAGLFQLHLVQLDNAKAGRIETLTLLEKLAANTGLRIDYGGGINSGEDIDTVLSAGANQVNVGSWAVRDPEGFREALRRRGDFIILSADARDEKIAAHGWQEDSGLDLLEFIENYLEDGLSYVTCTDISRDGRLEGPSFSLYGKIKKRFPDIHLTASGGISRMEDLKKLRKSGIDACIVGKAIYEGHINPVELGKFNRHA